LGFDFVRLPVDPKWAEGDAEERKDNLARLHCDIVGLLNEDLLVIVDLHATGDYQKDLAQNPSTAAARLIAEWTNLRPVFADLPADRIFIGVFNEPHIDTNTWWGIQDDVIKGLRPLYPNNTLIVTAGPDGGLWDLDRMQPYDDKKLIYDFHFYLPMFFTHHGANWFPPDSPEYKTMPIDYPAGQYTLAEDTDPDLKQYLSEDWNRAKLAGFINKIARWGRDNRVHVACLEFGVYRPFNHAHSRDNWVGDMRNLLENAGIPWALWEYRGNFGLLDTSGDPDEGMARALGLNHSSSP